MGSISSSRSYRLGCIRYLNRTKLAQFSEKGRAVEMKGKQLMRWAREDIKCDESGREMSFTQNALQILASIQPSTTWRSFERDAEPQGPFDKFFFFFLAEVSPTKT